MFRKQEKSREEGSLQRKDLLSICETIPETATGQVSLESKEKGGKTGLPVSSFSTKAILESFLKHFFNHMISREKPREETQG